MRVFENKLTELGLEDEEITYAFLVKQCTDRIPREGLVTSEQKKRLDVQCLIHDNLEAGEKIEIEEHIYNTIKACVVNFPWAMIHQDLVDFEADIKELKEVKNK